MKTKKLEKSMGLYNVVENILKITNESVYGRLDMDSHEANEIYLLLKKELIITL